MWIKLDNDIFVEEVDNPVKVVSLDELEIKLNRLKSVLLKLEDITHEDKEYQHWINSGLSINRMNIIPQIIEIENLIKELKKL